MRYAVLIIALLGVAATGYIGFIWYQDAQENRITEIRGKLGGEFKAMVDNRRLAAVGLMGASVLGLVGGVLAFMRTKYIPALLLILPAGVPGYFSTKSIPDDPKRVALVCSPLLLAGLLSFAIRSKPRTASAEGEAVEEEEQPQRGGKRPSMEEKKVGKKKQPGHAAPDEDAEAAFAALEMEGAEAEAAPAKHEDDIDLEAAAAEEESAAAEAAVAEEEEQVDLETAAAEDDERVDLTSAVAPDEEEVAAPAAEAEEEEAESTAAVSEEEEPAAPEWIDRFVCPSCDTYLKASAPLPVGKPFNCPKCHEPVTVTARV